MKARHFVFLAALAALTASDAMATGGRHPGSVLIYPVHRSGPKFFTVVSVTNTNLKPMTKVSMGGSTNLHFEYVNIIPDSNKPFCPKGCIVFNRIEFLTPADTMSVLTSCHNATSANGQEGYLVVSAEDPSAYRTRWSHNHLVGSELLINASGAVYNLNAIPFRSPVTEGGKTDLNTNGMIDFDGKEYETIPDMLYIDSFVAISGSQLTLINLTGKPGDLNRVMISAWNDNEYALSATLDFKCWFDQPLFKVNPLFTEAFLRRLPNDSKELDIDCDNKNDLETGWAIIESLGVRQSGGNSVSSDGAMLGSITSGPRTTVNGGHLLWESEAQQSNGQFNR